ncbi:alpha-ketoglutarate-dependent dioxygenase alkB homolog 4 [Procambarus clarkii]|uniref:alpha-ketoglutarate-dependent dioxygenase alkB homolog 4 n=1 Tax=Procambarus clarkii TaxID=6728 RepID=UPI001E673E13|nr:alpha-ketoglutarate-dependent dioxygenase alkB homolog 4-like [Procambarus clarkii]
MFHPRPCGCKGQRSCLVCEKDYGAETNHSSWVTEKDKECSYVYCPLCELAWPGWMTDSWKVHPLHQGDSVKFPGIKVILDFISEEEEKFLLTQIDEIPWDSSQSGRRKQNYGPKCNFKKRRVRTETFVGYPAYTKFIQDRFNTVDILCGFQTVEQCSLDYPAERGASIDPHIDDCWIWGERIPTLSLLIDSTLTLRKYRGPKTKYNLIDMRDYPLIVRKNGTVKEEREIETELSELHINKISTTNTLTNLQDTNSSKNDDPLLRNIEESVIRVPMPHRSLVILYGPVRYEWEHGILREDIPSRRVCITYRELTPTYLKYGQKAEIGEQILKASKNFWDH